MLTYLRTLKPLLNLLYKLNRFLYHRDLIKRKIYLQLIKILDKHRLVDLDVIYDERYFLMRKLWKSEVNKIVDVLYEEFRPDSVIDFGCSIGLYLLRFKEYGCKVLGVEGSSFARKHSVIDPNLIILHDLRDPLILDRKYDMALCLEVAEHIHEFYENIFLDNICSAADVIVFSSAKPGSGGVHHVNEKPAAYWIVKFAERGFKPDYCLTEKIKEKISGLKHIPWIRDNIIIFKRENYR
ncbi:MAG: methyltransferase domain-containing protein [Candidatus Bathyarchaeia archaeon]